MRFLIAIRETLACRILGYLLFGRLVRWGMDIGNITYSPSDVSIDPSHCSLASIGGDRTLSNRVCILAYDASTEKYTGYTKIGNLRIGTRTLLVRDLALGERMDAAMCQRNYAFLVYSIIPWIEGAYRKVMRG